MGGKVSKDAAVGLLSYPSIVITIIYSIFALTPVEKLFKSGYAKGFVIFVMAVGLLCGWIAMGMGVEDCEDCHSNVTTLYIMISNSLFGILSTIFLFVDIPLEKYPLATLPIVITILAASVAIYLSLNIRGSLCWCDETIFCDRKENCTCFVSEVT